jgi:hypothetical protein
MLTNRVGLTMGIETISHKGMQKHAFRGWFDFQFFYLGQIQHLVIGLNKQDLSVKLGWVLFNVQSFGVYHT